MNPFRSRSKTYSNIKKKIILHSRLRGQIVFTQDSINLDERTVEQDSISNYVEDKPTVSFRHSGITGTLRYTVLHGRKEKTFLFDKNKNIMLVITSHLNKD